MGIVTLLRRNLFFYWRTNLAVVAGVGIAVSVLAGAALVGESVRSSLRDLFLSRLGAADSVLVGTSFFREALSDSFPSACPLISLEGLVIHDRGRASHVAVYGVDERFWKFHGRAEKAPAAREILVSPDLASELGVASGDSILVRMQKPTAIPAEWLHGNKDNAGRAIRFTVREILPASEMGEFSLRAQQGAVRAVFVPLRRLQQELDLTGKVNTILLSKPGDVKGAFTLADVGLKIRGNSIESDGALISDYLASTVSQMGLTTTPVFTYLANTIRVGEREIPYSLVSAIGGTQVSLNEWAARDLGAKVGDKIQIEYYVWKDEGRLATESAEFTLNEIVPTSDRRDLAPEYPGMSDAKSLQDWDPPFPVDLRRVQPRDEDYWKTYRTTPKMIIPIEAGQRLWGSRFGKVTSIRLSAMPSELEKTLRDGIDPAKAGLFVAPVRQQGLAAAQGSTDFGEYFTYFSFFLVISALVLTGLFFRLGIEQRLREIGVLRALGFADGRIVRLFLAEGGILAILGSLIGVAGAAAYGALVLLGLRTFWVGAVGTKLLALHVSAASLAMGAAAGVATELISIALSTRQLRRLSPLRLLAGGGELARPPKRRYRALATVAAIGALALLAGAASGRIDQTAGFFGAGALLLSAFLLFEWTWLADGPTSVPRDVARLGFRNAGYRPGRSILCIALVAMATFLVVAIDAFRQQPETFSGDRKAGDGGYPLLAESILPVFYDFEFGRGARKSESHGAWEDHDHAVPASSRGRCELFEFVSVAESADLGRDAGFPSGRAVCVPGSEANPWLLLDAEPNDGAIPAIVDANTLEYTLHLKVGEVFSAGPVTLRIVAALRDSIFQSEFVISERNFVRAFPEQTGYRFFLIDTADPGKASQTLEESLSDYGFDAELTSGRLAGFHRVENTYLSTFQTLGSLGLILGTVGLAVVMLRNILERRRELALLRAIGYRPSDLAVMVMSESLFLLFSGLVIGVVCALLAIAPALSSRGGGFSAGSLGLLLVGVLLSGTLASWVAMRAVTRTPLLAALRSE